MEKEHTATLIAAILTLSEGIDSMTKMMRQNLSLHVDLDGNKIPDTFIPKLIPDTEQRFLKWKQDLEKTV